MRKLKHTLQRGIILLEVMLSLSIIAIILVMATRYFFAASNSQRINEMTSQLAAMQAQVAQWKLGRATYSGIAIGDIAPSLNDPSHWDGTNYTNAWNNNITLAAAGTGSQRYAVTTTLPDSTTCQSIAGRFPPIAAASGSDGSFCSGATYTFQGPITVITSS